MSARQPESIPRELLPFVGEVARPMLIGLGVLCIGTPMLFFSDYLSNNIPLPLEWYWFVGAEIAGIAFVIAGARIRKSSQRERELETEEEKPEDEKEQTEFIRTCSNWFRAFKNGAVSEYPTTDAIEYGLPMRSDEVCYLAAPGAILSRGNVHQLEISRGSNAGIALSALRIGGHADRKDSYSKVVHEETPPGTLFITSQRITFVSPPSVFLEIAPFQIVTAAWSGTYVMLLTTITPDENKNLLTFLLTNEDPAWLYVSAMLRLAVDHADGPNPLPDG